MTNTYNTDVAHLRCHHSFTVLFPTDPIQYIRTGLTFFDMLTRSAQNNLTDPTRHRSNLMSPLSKAEIAITVCLSHPHPSYSILHILSISKKVSINNKITKIITFLDDTFFSEENLPQHTRSLSGLRDFTSAIIFPITTNIYKSSCL